MSDLIDRQALLDEYDKAHFGPPGKARRLIEDAPAASRWHRLEDELPPKGFALIGARKRPPEISEDVWDMWVCEYDGEWGWQDMDGYALRGITHWMPIEPPEEDA